MLRIGGPNEKGVVTVAVHGKLTRSDYDQALPVLERLLDTHGKLRFLITLEEFAGFELGALWEDLKFDVRYRDHFGRMAVVGDRRWEEWGTRFSGLFFSDEVRFFYADQADAALEWVNA
ncbi:MAG: STAS/SEC14 domain-containing protein [Gammaproteobacteria bacterium]|nr:STAS/SEC14 domain-containing protein [Gammaproteobacteria bacterium]